jgi:hypothetical protein
MQVSPVTMSHFLPENHCSTQFTTVYKRLTEGGYKAFCFGHLLWASGFLIRKAFWVFGCRRLLEGKIAGGTLLKGENELKGGLLKGKELLKENC